MSRERVFEISACPSWLLPDLLDIGSSQSTCCNKPALHCDTCPHARVTGISLRGQLQLPMPLSQFRAVHFTAAPMSSRHTKAEPSMAAIHLMGHKVQFIHKGLLGYGSTAVSVNPYKLYQYAIQPSYIGLDNFLPPPIAHFPLLTNVCYTQTRKMSWQTPCP